jgi:hypothetical protein
VCLPAPAQHSRNKRPRPGPAGARSPAVRAALNVKAVSEPGALAGPRPCSDPPGRAGADVLSFRPPYRVRLRARRGHRRAGAAPGLGWPGCVQYARAYPIPRTEGTPRGSRDCRSVRRAGPARGCCAHTGSDGRSSIRAHRPRCPAHRRSGWSRPPGATARGAHRQPPGRPGPAGRSAVPRAGSGLWRSGAMR